VQHLGEVRRRRTVEKFPVINQRHRLQGDWISPSPVLLKHSLHVKATGLAGTARRIQKRIETAYSRAYERRMRTFNLGVIVVALIVLMILIVWLSDTWTVFQRTLRTF
jgi:hypothetical protein